MAALLFQRMISLQNDFTPTCMVHPDTYINKVVIGSEEGRLQVWNFSTGKMVFESSGWWVVIVFIFCFTIPLPCHFFQPQRQTGTLSLFLPPMWGTAKVLVGAVVVCRMRTLMFKISCDSWQLQLCLFKHTAWIPFMIEPQVTFSQPTFQSPCLFFNIGLTLQWQNSMFWVLCLQGSASEVPCIVSCPGCHRSWIGGWVRCKAHIESS